MFLTENKNMAEYREIDIDGLIEGSMSRHKRDESKKSDNIQFCAQIAVSVRHVCNRSSKMKGTSRDCVMNLQCRFCTLPISPLLF